MYLRRQLDVLLPIGVLTNAAVGHSRQHVIAPIVVAFSENVIGHPSASIIFSYLIILAILDFAKVIHNLIFLII